MPTANTGGRIWTAVKFWIHYVSLWLSFSVRTLTLYYQEQLTITKWTYWWVFLFVCLVASVKNSYFTLQYQ